MDEHADAKHTNELAPDHPLFDRGVVKTPTGIRITGITTPPIREGKRSEETPRFTSEDLDEACESAIGAPILSEHTTGEVLGRVVSAKPDSQGRIVVEAEIEDTVDGWNIINQVVGEREAGRVIGFSWGARHELTPDSKLCRAVTDKKLCELSITRSPEFSQDALVTAVSKRSELHDAARANLLKILRTDSGRAMLNAPAYFGKRRRRACTADHSLTPRPVF